MIVKAKPYVRWYIHKYLDAVLRNEKHNREVCLEKSDIEEMLKLKKLKKNKVECMGMIAEDEDTEVVFGHMFYEIHDDHYHILSLVIDPDFRRQGIATALIDSLKPKLNARRTRIVVDLRESNLESQLFLRNYGFLCRSVERNYFKEYRDSDVPYNMEDAYIFHYDMRESKE